MTLSSRPFYSTNVTLAAPAIQLMVTGVHTVQDISCVLCATRIGWKILIAHDWSEKWKEGKFLLELERLQREQGSQTGRS